MRVVSPFRFALFSTTIGALCLGCGGCKTEAGSTAPEVEQEDSFAADSLLHDVAAEAPIDTGSALEVDPGDVGDADWAMVRWPGVDCGLFELRNPAALSARSWTTCAEGCLETTAFLPGDTASFISTSSAATQPDGAMWLRIATANSTRRRLQILNLTTGATIAAVEQRSQFDHCLPVGGIAASPQTFVLYRDDDTILAGNADSSVPLAPITWQPKWLPGGIVTSAFRWGGGVGVAFSGGRVSLVRTATPGVVEPLVGTSSSLFRAMGVGPHVGWTTIDAVQGWTDGKGLVTIWTAGKSPSSAMMVDRQLWVAAHGPRARDGEYDSAELMWQPYDAASTTGPSLTATGCLDDVQAFGATVAVTACDSGGANRRVITSDLATGRQWTIHARPGKRIAGVLAVSASEILIAEQPAEVSDVRISGLLRLNISKLDSLAAVW